MNSCLEKGHFPDQQKTALILPLPKKAIHYLHIIKDILFTVLLDKLQDLNANWTTKSKYIMGSEYTSPKRNGTEIAERIRKFYFGDQVINSSTFQELTKVGRYSSKNSRYSYCVLNTTFFKNQ